MKFHRSHHLLLGIFLLLGWGHNLLAQSHPTPVSLATWNQSEKGPQLWINVGDALSEKQKNMINSGFSTFSNLNLATNEGSPLDFSVKCTVKFDTWEEFYDMIQVTHEARRLRASKFNDYASLCLTAKIALTELPADLARTGGTLKVSLAVNPISQEKAGEIRTWLINQQSGVIQNLFSHMIGDLKLDEQIEISVQVPQWSQTVPKKKSSIQTSTRQF